VVDDNHRTAKFDPKNTILIPKWEETPLDRILLDWLPNIFESCLRAKNVRTVKAGIAERRRSASESVEYGTIGRGGERERQKGGRSLESSRMI
jgi:hypothetical protein